MEAESTLELVAIETAINVARAWAREHFRADAADSATLLDPPSFKVVFPDVDLMVVTPWMYGLNCGPSIEYRLRFHKDRRVSWHPTEKLYGLRQLPDLFVTPGNAQREEAA